MKSRCATIPRVFALHLELCFIDSTRLFVVTGDTYFTLLSSYFTGCLYKGKNYKLGDRITRHEDRKQNWCGGLECKENGKLGFWNDHQCFE